MDGCGRDTPPRAPTKLSLDAGGVDVYGVRFFGNGTVSDARDETRAVAVSVTPSWTCQ